MPLTIDFSCDTFTRLLSMMQIPASFGHVDIETSDYTVNCVLFHNYQDCSNCSPSSRLVLEFGLIGNVGSSSFRYDLYVNYACNSRGVLRQKESSDLIIDALSPEIINNLDKTTKLMVSVGFEQDFSNVYISFQRECLEESISRLRMQKLSVKWVQKVSWEDFINKIERWIKASNVLFKILFPTERRLCDWVFCGVSTLADLSFMDVCRESILQLLNFADTIALGSRSPKRFMELENRIHQDPGEATVFGGQLHSITCYMMNYLFVACESRQTLEEVFKQEYKHIFKEYPKIEDRMHSLSSLLVSMEQFMEIFESNLEAKSKSNKDHALCCVLLMNNYNYIVQMTEDVELGTVLGDVMIQKYTAKVQQHREHYQ